MANAIEEKVQETSEQESEKTNQLPTKKKGVTLEEIEHPSGSTAIAARGKDGKFVKKTPSTQVSSATIKRQFQDWMLKTDEGDPKKRTDLQKIYDAALQAALDMDPDVRMATIKAQEFLMTRTWGKPDPSDEAMEAGMSSGVKVIVINQPPLSTPPIERPERKALQPAFIDAEVVPEKQ
jgi:hypothetical protein